MEQAQRVGQIEKIKISDIIIGDRARVIMGDLQSMALSLQVEGQLTPLIVDLAGGGRFNLIDGERRIKAARILGWTQIECTMMASLSEDRRKELELVMCVQRQQLTFMEEAIATQDLVNRRKKNGMVGGLAKFGKSIRNKDVAIELNMTESRMSENMRIAEALNDHPELEADNSSRTEFLRRVRNRDYFVPDGGTLQAIYKENFIITTPMGCMETIVDRIIDLAVLHPNSFDQNVDRIIDLAVLHPNSFDQNLLDETHKRLKSQGQIVVFCKHIDLNKWETALKGKGMNIGPQPYIWHVKNEGDYENYLWAGKNITSPIRPMMNMLQAARPAGGLSGKAKPMQLILNIVKCCTERAAFVVVPQCEDIETVRCCIEIGRNIRAATANKILRDKLILSVVKQEQGA